jgi:hypothetical protein
LTIPTTAGSEVIFRPSDQYAQYPQWQRSVGTMCPPMPRHLATFSPGCHSALAPFRTGTLVRTARGSWSLMKRSTSAVRDPYALTEAPHEQLTVRPEGT